MAVHDVLQRARDMGVTFEVVDGNILYRPKSAAPPDLVEEIRQHKAELLDYLRQEPNPDVGEPWILREWRRVSIPDWRRILRESIEQGDHKREEYARWMLREVLLDPKYEGPSS